MAKPYSRDMVGYGGKFPDPKWPGGARIAVNFVLNYEEGSEYSIDDDNVSETILSEASLAGFGRGKRDLAIESIYEYGSRAGFWRLAREFERRKIPLTLFGCSMALERNPEATAAFVELGHEIACHGWRWIHYQDMDAPTERRHMKTGTQIIRRMTGGKWPLGWYTGRDSPNTRRLLVEHGGYEYDSDYYGDELPFWTRVEVGKRLPVPHLVVPYTLDANDMRFATPQGFNTADHFFAYLRDSFDVLYAEGADAPKMLSIGMRAFVEILPPLSSRNSSYTRFSGGVPPSARQIFDDSVTESIRSLPHIS